MTQNVYLHGKNKLTLVRAFLIGLVLLVLPIVIAILWKPQEVIRKHEFEYTLKGSKYPVLFAGESVTVSIPIKKITYFMPIFGPERKVVNPSPPKIKRNKRLVFEMPGEYYLYINGFHPLKAVVLDPNETISEDVLRIFDFLVANLIFCNGDNANWYQDKPGFINHWFKTDKRTALLCGPTADFFRALVEDRFQLPTRVASFPGIYRRKGKIKQTIHNIPEVYLPDVKRFVLFDINNAFVVRWLGAMDIARLINERLDDRALLTASDLAALNLDLYPGAPETYKPVDYVCNPKKQLDFLVPAEMLTRFSTSKGWVEDPTLNCPWGCGIAKWFYGGVAYFRADWAGTSFLRGYTYASLHKDPELTRAAVEWAEKFGLHPVIVVSEDELRWELDQGFAQWIQAKPWLARLPPHR